MIVETTERHAIKSKSDNVKKIQQTLNDPNLCMICMGPPDDPVNLCVETSHPFLCRGCAKEYIANKINSAHMGSCPDINCPYSHDDGKLRTLKYTDWINIVDSNVVTKYTELAKSLTYFLCGGCHNLRSNDIGIIIPPVGKTNIIPPTTITTNAELKLQLDSDITMYENGQFSLDEIYRQLTTKYMPSNIPTNDRTSQWQSFTYFLSCVQNPAKRAFLHVRYLINNPRFFTLCCNREHCFTCKTRDFHEGKTCIEIARTKSRDPTLSCTKCGVHLTKGDGCDTVTCVCGNQFSWSRELDIYDKTIKFFEMYPKNTHEHCANILCGINKVESGIITIADYWYKRHMAEIRELLKNIFKRMYSSCPSQCAITLIPERVPIGIQYAVEFWKQDNKQEIENCIKNRNSAIDSIFPSLCHVSDRPKCARDLTRSLTRISLKSSTDGVLIESAKRWINKNKPMYDTEMELLKITQIKQFLYLYGNKDLFFAKFNGGCVDEWNRSISNPDLTYTNDNKSVRRDGSVSCYPACLAILPDLNSSITVVIDEAHVSSNWLTFGLVTNNFPTSSSDGIGRTHDTWGLSNDRSNDNFKTYVFSSGSEVNRIPKFEVGDILKGVVDIQNETFDIFVNDVHIYQFTIPNLPIDNFRFGMTFANNHKVTIINSNHLNCKQNNSILNNDHTEMYMAMYNYVRNTFDGKFDTSKHTEMYEALNIKLSQKWTDFCKNTENAMNYYESIKQILSVKDYVPNLPFKLTWEVLVSAAAWYNQNKLVLEKIQLEQKKMVEEIEALEFLSEHDANIQYASMMAALRVHTDGSSDKQKAISYMNYFRNEMNAWYQDDSVFIEPIVPNVAQGCRSVPRHIGRSCSCMNH